MPIHLMFLHLRTYLFAFEGVFYVRLVQPRLETDCFARYFIFARDSTAGRHASLLFFVLVTVDRKHIRSISDAEGGEGEDLLRVRWLG